MKGQVGGFQNPGVCLQAFPSFLPLPLSALFWRGNSLLLNPTETLTTQATNFQKVQVLDLPTFFLFLTTFLQRNYFVQGYKSEEFQLQHAQNSCNSLNPIIRDFFQLEYFFTRILTIVLTFEPCYCLTWHVSGHYI